MLSFERAYICMHAAAFAQQMQCLSACRCGFPACFNELIADVEKAEIEGGCAGSALARATSRRMSMSVDHRRTSGLLETGSTDLIAPVRLLLMV
eukprot:356051-Chlamydomonas_euryale.AAC.4